MPARAMTWCKIVGDIVGRTLSVENARGEVVAVMAKTGTALLKTAVYGGGSESTVDGTCVIICVCTAPRLCIQLQYVPSFYFYLIARLGLYHFVQS